jgi:hypothetical protein
MALPPRHPRKCLPVDLVVAAVAVAIELEILTLDKTTLSFQL